jgi:hypothetical protein
MKRNTNTPPAWVSRAGAEETMDMTTAEENPEKAQDLTPMQKAAAYGLGGVLGLLTVAAFVYPPATLVGITGVALSKLGEWLDS